MTYKFKLDSTEIQNLVQEKKGAQNDFFMLLNLPDGTSQLVKITKELFERLLVIAKPKQIS